MKNLFNLAAVILRAQTAAVKAITNVLRNEGGVVVDVIRDIRISYTSSNLPAAIADYIRTSDAESANVPDWVDAADAEIALLKKDFAYTATLIKDDAKGTDRAVA